MLAKGTGGVQVDTRGGQRVFGYELLEQMVGNSGRGGWGPGESNAHSPGPQGSQTKKPGLGGQRAGDAEPVPSAAPPGPRLQRGRSSWGRHRAPRVGGARPPPGFQVPKKCDLLPWQVWSEGGMTLRKIILVSRLRI